MEKHEFKQLRLKLDFTQKQMADKLGMSVRMYAYIEAGERELSANRMNLLEELRLRSN